MSRPISINSPANRRIVQALQDHGPMNIDDLAKAAHVSRRTLDSTPYYLPQLKKAKLLHVCGWIRATVFERSGMPVPVFKAGPGKDAPRPKPLDERERSEKYRKTAKYEAYVARKNVRTGGVQAVDPLLAAMMGAGAAA